jgi:hypothetical protein
MTSGQQFWSLPGKEGTDTPQCFILQMMACTYSWIPGRRASLLLTDIGPKVTKTCWNLDKVALTNDLASRVCTIGYCRLVTPGAVCCGTCAKSSALSQAPLPRRGECQHSCPSQLLWHPSSLPLQSPAAAIVADKRNTSCAALQPQAFA